MLTRLTVFIVNTPQFTHIYRALDNRAQNNAISFFSLEKNKKTNNCQCRALYQNKWTSFFCTIDLQLLRWNDRLLIQYISFLV